MELLLDPAPLPAGFTEWLKRAGSVSDGKSSSRNAPAPAIALVRLSSVGVRPIEWLWPGWLPLGKLCELAGAVGLSKSLLLLDLAARVSSSGVMPDGAPGVSGGVGILSAEDGLEDTILPRLKAAGADLAKIGFVAELDRTPLLLPDHLERIEVRLRELDIRLLLIDPLTAFLAHAASDREVRRALHSLKGLAERLRCTVLWLRHLGGRGRRPTLGPARSGLMVGRDPNDPGQCVLAQRRNNLGELQSSLTYRLEKVVEYDCCRIVWGERSALTADELDEASARKKKEESPEKRSKFEQARTLLKTGLAEGPLAIADVRRQARDACIAERTLERAAAALRLKVIVPPGAKFKQGWLWALPDGEL